MSNEFVVNLAGAGESRPGDKGGGRWTTGPHKVAIEDVTDKMKDGTLTSWEFKIVNEAGASWKIWVGLDVAKAGNLKAWRTLLLSLGYQPEDIDQPNLKISKTLFKGKPAHVYFTDKDENNPSSQPDCKFISVAAYEQLLGNADVGGAVVERTSAPAARTSVPTMAVSAPKPANTASLRSMLQK
jgi:hypothetical protein